MEPKILLDTHELAWAAGFVDGEGYFKFTKDKHGYVGIALSVHQVDRRALDRLHAALNLGKVRGPYGPYDTNKQPFYTFEVGDFEGTQAGIAFLWKWLCPIKRNQAKNVLIRAREER